MSRDFPLALLAAVLLTALVWAEPRPIDDLFIALAGGRDVLAGRLGAPDTWSFTTDGRVWLNQNWGSHVLFHLAHAAAGDTGLLVLKALLLAAVVAGVAAAAHARRADWPIAVLVAGLTLAASRGYLDLRPSLVTLVLASGLGWVLARTPVHPRTVWLAVPLLAVWANAHGGFVFGLALLALWAAATAVSFRAALPPALGALTGALALAAFANPFGIANLTHPFVVARNPAWRSVAEWIPLFGSDATAFGSRWEACTFVAALAVMAIGRLALRGRRNVAAATTAGGLAPGAARALAIFDVAAASTVVLMALRARRFVPLALVVLAPLLAAELAWWRRRLATPWPTRVLAIAAVIAAVVAAPPVLRRYRADNPIFAGATVFARMVDAPTLPAGAAEFVRANHLGGRAYAAWEWEGFLRFTETPVTVLIGGRAQQVYDEATLRLHQHLRTGATSARTALAERQVGLAILPLTALYAEPVNDLVYGNASPWVYAYCDGRHAVLADTSHPELGGLVTALQDDVARYSTPAIAATSRMMYLASPRSGAAPAAVRSAAEAAARTAPTPLAYAVLGDLAVADPSTLSATRAGLAAERDRLLALPPADADGYALAQARLTIARVETALAARSRDAAAAARIADDLAGRTRDMRALLTTWAYGWNPDVF